MAIPDPTRFYARTQDGLHRAIMWVQNVRPNEMLLGFYGLNQNVSLLRGEWPDREVGPDEFTQRYRWEEMQNVGQRFDHITCHPDGKFHVKVAGGGVPYRHELKRVEPLGPDTPLFLEFMVLTDRIGNYQVTLEESKTPNCVVSATHDESLAFLGFFAGSKYDLMRHVGARLEGRLPFHQAFLVESSTLQR